MNISYFVSGSACLLMGWLVVTFFIEVPAASYPTLGRGSVPVSAKVVRDSDRDVVADSKPASHGEIASH